MTTLRIHHGTRYRYERPVSFGVHRLMLRPRDGHDMRILDSALSISPAAELRWELDTFGNSVAYASFSEEADTLTIESELLLRRYGLDEPVVGLAVEVVAGQQVQGGREPGQDDGQAAQGNGRQPGGQGHAGPPPSRPSRYPRCRRVWISRGPRASSFFRNSMTWTSRVLDSPSYRSSHTCS